MPPLVGDRTAFQAKALQRLGKVESSKLELTAEAWTGVIDDAVDAYGRLRPNTKIFQGAGSDTKRRYVLEDATLPGWVLRTSRVLRVESVSGPDTDDEFVTEIPSSEWTQRRAADGKDVLFLESAVGASQTIRIHFSIPHVIHDDNETLTTVPDGDCEAIVALTVGKAAEWIARTACDLANQRLGADDVDYQAFSDRWAKRANESLKAAAERLQGEPSAAPAAASTVEWPSTDPISGIPRVSH